MFFIVVAVLVLMSILASLGKAVSIGKENPVGCAQMMLKTAIILALVSLLIDAFFLANLFFYSARWAPGKAVRPMIEVLFIALPGTAVAVVGSFSLLVLLTLSIWKRSRRTLEIGILSALISITPIVVGLGTLNWIIRFRQLVLAD